MAWNFGRILRPGRLPIGAAPQIADTRRGVGDAGIHPSKTDLSISRRTVEYGNSGVSTSELSGPDLVLPGLPDAFCLMSGRILIDRDDIAIRENVADRCGHVAHVVAGNQRRREHRPQAHVSSVLRVRHVAIADFQHIGIVPVPGPGVWSKPVLTKAEAADGIP